MQISYDPAKRDQTLALRGIDMADAGEVLTGLCVTVEDERFDYGETRLISVGYLRGRMVVIVWTPRDDGARVAPAPKREGRRSRDRRPFLVHRTNFLYLIRCGWSASGPFRFFRSSMYAP